MLRYIIHKRLDAAERLLGAPVDYLRFIYDHSRAAFFKFAMFMPLASHRKSLPVAAQAVAGITATRLADCGTCLQIAVNQAKLARVPKEIIHAALHARPQELSDDLADVYHFTEHVVRATGEENTLRERIRSRYGDAALVDLALAIATSQVFPLTKRALGYATSCSLVHVKV